MEVLLLGLLLMVSTVASASPDPATVQLRGDFFGAAFDTPMRLDPVTPTTRSELAVMDANRRALQPMARWVEASAAAVSLDDYGRFRLVVTAVDALPVRVSARRGDPVSVSEAVASGSWTTTDRLLAIGGGLQAAGYDVNVFANRRGQVLLGLRTDDDSLNVNAVNHRWETISGGRRTQSSVSWVLWDGVNPIGRLETGALGGVKALDRSEPSRNPLRFGERHVPDFAMKRTKPGSLALAGTGRTLRYVRRPDAAAYLALFPELQFAHQVGLARAELRRIGLADAVRQAVADAPDEVTLVDTLIRSLQSAFVYEPGPVRSMHELTERGKGDCDQLSLLLAALLIEVGYRAEDVVAVRWSDHLGLAVRPRTGDGPEGGSGVDLSGGRYHLVDVTHYMYENGRLTSRWGRTSPEHGRQVEVLPLDVGEVR